MTNNESGIASQAQPDNKPKRLNLSDGMLLGLASTGAYFLAFNYEKGYTSVFHIPPRFISVTLLNVFIVAALFLAVAWSLSLVANVGMSVPLAPTLHPTVRSGLAGQFSIICLYLACYLIAGFSWVVFIAFGATLLYHGLFYFVIPFILHRKKGPLTARLEAQAEANRETVGFFEYLQRRYGRNAFLIGLYYFIAFQL